jgi:short-subunit dehydrogenase
MRRAGFECRAGPAFTKNVRRQEAAGLLERSIMNELKGKSAIVTGSSRGIGRAIALRLAQSGAGVVINYAGNRDAAQQVVKEINASGGAAIAVQADVSKPNARRDAYKSIDSAGLEGDKPAEC